MSTQLGRVILNEGALRAFEESTDGEDRSVSLSGAFFTSPQIPLARMAGLHDDVLGLPGALVPVAFDVKDHRNGFYRIEETKSNLLHLGPEQVMRIEWEAQLIRQGSDTEVDLESRFAGPINRLNAHSLAGERWHTPPPHTAYLAGFTSPGSVVRVGSEGPLRTYLDLDDGINPRWQGSLLDYKLGRVRVRDIGERAGTSVKLGSPWTLSNSLVEVVSASGSTLDVRWHNGTSWSGWKNFGFTLGGSGLGTAVAASILHNEYERVTIRVLFNRSPVGRVVIDLTLRRGARFVEYVMKSSSSATLGVTRTTNEGATAASGYVRATSDDADGHRYLLGSLGTFTSDLSAGAISRAASVVLNGFIGAEIGDEVQDQGDKLMLQYVGAGSEVVQAVKR